MRFHCAICPNIHRLKIKLSKTTPIENSGENNNAMKSALLYKLCTGVSVAHCIIVSIVNSPFLFSFFFFLYLFIYFFIFFIFFFLSFLFLLFSFIFIYFYFFVFFLLFHFQHFSYLSFLSSSLVKNNLSSFILFCLSIW